VNSDRYVFAVDLKTGQTARVGRPDVISSLDGAEISAPGKCATIVLYQGVAYVGAHSKCAAKLWRVASGSDEGRPNAPWVAYRDLTEDQNRQLNLPHMNLALPPVARPLFLQSSSPARTSTTPWSFQPPTHPVEIGLCTCFQALPRTTSYPSAAHIA